MNGAKVERANSKFKRINFEESKNVKPIFEYICPLSGVVYYFSPKDGWLLLPMPNLNAAYSF